MDELYQVRLTFITESRELLEEMENSLLTLEQDPGDEDTINSLFRSAHTIKGSAGIVDIESVEKFTHVVENLLSKIREHEIGISNEIIEVLLQCRDHIFKLVDLAEDGSEPGADVAERDSALIERLNAFLGSPAGSSNEASKDEAAGPVQQNPGVQAPEADSRTVETDAWHISLRFGPDVLRNGMDPASFISYLAKLGEIISLATLFDSMPGAAEMDPETCYLGFEIDFRSDFDKKALEDVFEFVRDDCVIHILPPHSRIESYVDLIAELPEDISLIGEMLVRGGALTQSELDHALALQNGAAAPGGESDGKQLIGEILINEGVVYPEVLDAALEKQKKNKSIKARDVSTIRIEASKLDALVNLVGELVISSANMCQHAQRIEDASLIESASVMTRLVEDIRDNTMKMRMIPIGETFTRFKRVVRDIGNDNEKQIDLRVSGGETELDKTVIEKINDPLMHLVRNAADHGIETPGERQAQGKPAAGTICLNAYHDAGTIVIEITDDGKGLNRMRILDKAIGLGLVGQNQTLTDAELFRLIFEPGFSTAEKITKLSGRGVGMDVVRRNIESLRGTIEVESTEGRGTTIRIRLPLTLAIIDGFLVRLAGNSYVIPLEMVVECVELPAAEKDKNQESGYISLRGEPLPYLRLRSYFNEHGKPPVYENIVVVHNAGQKIGLVADELVGEVQTVIKSLGEVYKDVRGVSGATIMGNGEVSLILDIPRLIESVEREMAA